MHIDEALPHGQVVHLADRSKELPEKRHLAANIRMHMVRKRPKQQEINGSEITGCMIKLTIHLIPGVLEKPTCRFTNDV
jgi:hypothetical protein